VVDVVRGTDDADVILGEWRQRGLDAGPSGHDGSRQRTVAVEHGGQRILVDARPDLRRQHVGEGEPGTPRAPGHSRIERIGIVRLGDQRSGPLLVAVADSDRRPGERQAHHRGVAGTVEC
jgi:hypothetical protein